jgi:hypothetical protein
MCISHPPHLCYMPNPSHPAIYFLEFNPSSLYFSTTTFRGMALSGEPTLLGPIDGVGSPDDEGRAIPRNVVVEKHRDDG